MIDGEKNIFYDESEWNNTLLLPSFKDKKKFMNNSQSSSPAESFECFKNHDDSGLSLASSNSKAHGSWFNCSLEASLERLLLETSDINSINKECSVSSNVNEDSTSYFATNKESYEAWQYLVNNNNSWNDYVNRSQNNENYVNTSWIGFNLYEKINKNASKNDDYNNLYNLPEHSIISDPIISTPSTNKTCYEQFSPESQTSPKFKSKNNKKLTVNNNMNSTQYNGKCSRKNNLLNKSITTLVPTDSKSFNNPLSNQKTPTYSRKVFIGGLPHDISQDNLIECFSIYGGLTVDWPHKNESLSHCPPKGYAFLLFKEYESVDKLISNCFKQKNDCHSDDKFYYKVSSPMMADKTVQIKPWLLKHIEYSKESSPNIDLRKTIFIGGIPRPLKASELHVYINGIYGNVCHAAIDVDPDYLYPKGAGRVTFSSQSSYLEAIKSRFLQMSTCEAGKRIEVKPYFPDDQKCDYCAGLKCDNRVVGLFCSKASCLMYLCEACWKIVHSTPDCSDHIASVKGTVFQTICPSNGNTLNISQLIDE